MADILITGGGGGIASSEDTTAQSPQVLENYTYLGADTDDDVGTGTMLNRSVVGKNNAVGISSTYPNIAMVPGSNGQVNTATNSLQYANIMVPEGYYNGSTYVGIAPSSLASGMGITANKIAQGQTIAGVAGTYTSDGTATNDLVYPGKVYYSKGQRGVGSMPTQGGSTITPGTAAKTAVAANRYVTGNVTVAGDGNLVAENIKKNVTIFGVKGTCEGWFPTATDLYLRGQNIWFDTSYNGSFKFEAGELYVNPSYSGGGTLHFKSAFDFSPYKKLNFQFKYESANFELGAVIELQKTSSGSAIVSVNPAQHNNEQTVSMDVSSLYQSDDWYINFSIRQAGIHVYHIWVS